MSELRIGLVVHPRRPIDNAIAAAEDWVTDRGGVYGQVPVEGQDRRVADEIDPRTCDLLLAIGGDGTVLAAVHHSATCGTPVLGVACGSLGALTAVKASEVAVALDRFDEGDWHPRRLPALEVERDGEPLGLAFNDLVVVRDGGGQVIVDADVNGDQYARLAGDGVVVATPLGSSAYTLAAGGPLVAATAAAMVLTPLAPHAGSVPSVVLGGDDVVDLGVDGGYAGARIERDGRTMGDQPVAGEEVPFKLTLRLRTEAATLVELGGETLFAGLRRRGIIADSARMAARDARAAAEAKRS